MYPWLGGHGPDKAAGEADLDQAQGSTLPFFRVNQRALSV